MSATATSMISSPSSQTCAGTTVSNNVQASQISLCPSVTGDVDLGGASPAYIELTVVEEIQGDLLLRDMSDIHQFGSETLKTIDGALGIGNSMVDKLALPNLTAVKDVYFYNVGAISDSGSTFSLHDIQSLTLANTSIVNMTGFDVQSMVSAAFLSNSQLSTVILQPHNITESLMIAGNGGDAASFDVSLPNLEWIQDLVVKNATSLTMPSISTINGSLILDGNRFAAFSAPTSLRSIYGGLNITNNALASEISLPQLTTLTGDLIVSDNTELALLGFDSLGTIKGDVSISGALTSASLPSLTLLDGSFTLNSTAAMSCASLDALAAKGVIRGTYICNTPTDNGTLDVTSASNGSAPASATNSASSTTISAPSSTASKSNLQPLDIGMIVGSTCAAALILGIAGFWLTIKRWRQQTRAYRARRAAEEAEEHGPPPAYKPDEGQVSEMATGREMQELPASHGASEVDRETALSKPEGLEILHEMPAGDVEVQHQQSNEATDSPDVSAISSLASTSRFIEHDLTLERPVSPLTPRVMPALQDH